MGRARSMLSRRRVGRIAASLGTGVAAIPVLLGVLAEPVAAATSSGGTVNAQQIVADVECDAGWLLWDVQPYNLGLPGVPSPPPFCDPVPSQLAGL